MFRNGLPFPIPRWLAILLVLVFVLGVGLRLLHAGIYGWTVFVLIPFALGALLSAAVRPRTGLQAVLLGVLAVGCALAALLVRSMEGLICLAMALPLAAPAGALGSWLVYELRNRPAITARRLSVLAVLPPVSLAFDAYARPPIYQVRTSVIVNSPALQVWQHVVSFSELPEPKDWFFRAGVAYPKRARIAGAGPGAVRYCEFSTGPFVEPIEVWREPQLLQFRVTANPAPLEEWNPIGRAEPMHLHGYLVSQRGQFQLTPLPGGRTLLEGTTWYRHSLWPAEYWRWWSDAIIHRIHLRVLNHVKMLSERTQQMDR